MHATNLWKETEILWYEQRCKQEAQNCAEWRNDENLLEIHEFEKLHAELSFAANEALMRKFECLDKEIHTLNSCLNEST